MSSSTPLHTLLVTGARTFEGTECREEVLQSLRRLWRSWDAMGSEPLRTSQILLLSGNASRGADRLLEQLCSEVGISIERHPADFRSEGRGAGFLRNQRMIDRLGQLRAAGSSATVLACSDLCTKQNCPKTRGTETIAGVAAHFSHGTMHCRTAAITAQFDVHDVLHPRFRH